MIELPPGYLLRSARPDDIPAINEVERAADQLFEPTGLLAGVEPGVGVPDRVYQSAMSNGLLFVIDLFEVGPVAFTLCSERMPDLYIDQISVDPRHGRKGLGSALLLKVFREAEARKIGTVSLSTFRDVPWNAPYYSRFGFKELSRKKLEPWMLELETAQAQYLDVTKRCFMRRKVRRRWANLLPGQKDES